MGKSRKPRYRAQKPNPVGIQSLRDISLNEELNGDDQPENALSTIRDQLQSGNRNFHFISEVSFYWIDTD